MILPKEGIKYDLINIELSERTKVEIQNEVASGNGVKVWKQLRSFIFIICMSGRIIYIVKHIILSENYLCIMINFSPILPRPQPP